MAWYLLRATSRQEAKAMQSLTELGLRSYCPMRTIWDRRSKERDATKKVALFSGYIFAQIPEERGLYGVHEADGVLAFVMCSGASGERQAATVSPSIVDGIILAESLGLFNDTYSPPTVPWAPQKGDQVMAVGELMNGRIGEIVKVKGDKRIKVLFKAMRQAVNMSREDVQPLPDDADVVAPKAA